MSISNSATRSRHTRSMACCKRSACGRGGRAAWASRVDGGPARRAQPPRGGRPTRRACRVGGTARRKRGRRRRCRRRRRSSRDGQGRGGAEGGGAAGGAPPTRRRSAAVKAKQDRLKCHQRGARRVPAAARDDWRKHRGACQCWRARHVNFGVHAIGVDAVVFQARSQPSHRHASSCSVAVVRHSRLGEWRGGVGARARGGRHATRPRRSP